MRKTLLMLLSLLPAAGIAAADNVVTYTYDSAGNRVTKVVSSPSKGNGSDTKPSSQASQSGEGESQTDDTDTQDSLSE